MDYQIRKIWNVIATIPGTVEPDRWVMIGNHRDAWVYGAVDPGSGTAATMEMCRALGAAVKNGWKPRRTLLYASWDAEEYGLVGSTEWAEENSTTINEKAVLLLNVDSAVSGPEFGASGVPSLRELVLDAAGAIVDPRTGKSLRSDWIECAARDLGLDRAAGPLRPALGRDRPGRFPSRIARARRPAASSRRWARLVPDPTITAFLDHLAVPALDVGFHGGYGVYHSIYDDFNWMEKFGDPEFLTHATAARLYTLIAMRAAAAEVVPFKFVPYGHALRDHVDELRSIHCAASAQGRVDDRPVASAEFVGLPSLVEAVRAFQLQAEQLDRATAAVVDHDRDDGPSLARLNDRLSQVERAFLLENGLPDAPGSNTRFTHPA